MSCEYSAAFHHRNILHKSGPTGFDYRRSIALIIENAGGNAGAKSWTTAKPEPANIPARALSSRPAVQK